MQASTVSATATLPFPHPPTVVEGDVRVRVYFREKGHYRYWTVADKSSGVRRFRNFKTHDAAVAFARRVAKKIAKGQTQSPVNRSIGVAARTGCGIEEITRTFVQAWDLLGGKNLILEAVQSHLKAQVAQEVSRVTLNDAMVAFKAHRKEHGASERYLKDIGCRLSRFVTDFNCDMAQVDKVSVQAWIDGLGLSAQSQRNYRTVLHTFFEFGRKRGWSAANPAHELETGRVKRTDLGILTAEELKKLYDVAGDWLAPLVFSAHAGMRSAEIERLTWEDIDFGRGLVILRAGMTKTASRRTIPLCPSALARLIPLRKTGLIWTETSGLFYKEQGQMAKRAGIAWKANVLRHSYASYRYALLQDDGKVAAELGNTPRMVHQQYREVAFEDDAKRWFNV